MKELLLLLALASHLAILDSRKEFHIYVDASQFGNGYTLVDEGAHGLDHPLYFASRRLTYIEKFIVLENGRGLWMIYAI